MHIVKRAIKMHVKADRDRLNPAEFLIGSFDGLKVLTTEFTNFSQQK